MTAPAERRRVLFVAPKREAQPILSELRSTGHQVSLVEDLDEADQMLRVGGFDAAVLKIENLALLLEQKVHRENEGKDDWRRAMAGMVHDLTSMIHAFGRIMQDAQGSPPARDLEGLSDSADTLRVFAMELIKESNPTQYIDPPASVDLEDTIEAAAVVVYPSAVERGQRLAVSVDSEVAEVRTLPTCLKRALKNVLEYVSSHSEKECAISVEAAKEGRECVISISSSAGDIAWSDVRRISTRSSYGSDAFPLAVAQELAVQLGGRFWIESEKHGNVAVFLAIPHRRHRGKRAAGAPGVRST